GFTTVQSPSAERSPWRHRWRRPCARDHRRTGPAHRGEVRHSGRCCEKRTSIRQQKGRRPPAIIAIRVSVGLTTGQYLMIECYLTRLSNHPPRRNKGDHVA